MNTYLGFQCCLEMNNNLWFSSFRGNGLFRYNGKDVEYILGFGEEGIQLFTDIKLYKENLYFVPLTATQIYRYNIISKKLESFYYGLREISGFSFSILYQQYIYMFPVFYAGILKLNLDTFDMEIINDWINEEFEGCRISEEGYFRGDYVKELNVVYIPFYNAHAVLEFHLEDGNSVLHNIGNQGYSTIASDGKRFWMAPRKNGNIVSWNPVTGEIEEYQNFPKGYKPGACIGSFYQKGNVWMFPEKANMVLKINTATGEMEEEKLFSDICNYKWSEDSIWRSEFIYMKNQGNRILLCSGKSSEVVFFYPDRNVIERFRICLPDKLSKYYHEEPDSRYLLFRKRKFREQIKKGKIFSESDAYGIKEYMQDTESDDEDNEKEHSLSVGEVIYKNIISCLNK